jgi:hypothetical protein
VITIQLDILGFTFAVVLNSVHRSGFKKIELDVSETGSASIILYSSPSYSVGSLKGA